ncbi:MAG: PQQ-binding-like beta-propeller repeat protein [Prolixibacteraceae bacterium]
MKNSKESSFLIVKMVNRIFLWSFLFFIFNSCSNKNQSAAFNWPQFRGSHALGISDEANLPLTWNNETGENIRWKTEIPGLGHSSPIVWGNRLFVTTAISSKGKNEVKVGLYGNIDSDEDQSEHEFRIICLDKRDGKILWDQLAKKGIPGTKRHTKASFANSTPATNGKFVVAFFGSDGLYCYDMEGHLQWSKNFGRMNAGPYTDPEFEWGFANSPVIEEDKLVIQSDFLGDSFLAVYNLATGAETWLTHRDEISNWCTPTIVNYQGQKQIIVNGYQHIGGYDFKTGKEIWKMHGGGDAPVPTPVFANKLIYIHSAHGKLSPIYAIRPNAKGDITLQSDSTSNEYIVWSIKRGAAYMPTNLVYQNRVYNMRMNGQLSVFDALSGEKIYRESIPEARGITASGVAANNRLYYSTEQGTVFVLKAGDQFEVLAQNHLDDVIMATPAISENSLYIRTQHHLIAVGE